jgi:hypothetical protein
MLRAGLRWLGLWLALSASACASKSEGAGSHAGAGDCSARADPLAVGLSKLSSNGTRFELVQLSPAIPVQSTTAPGNSWSVALHDVEGAPLRGGALDVTTYMPDHGHAGPSSLGLESADGIYTVDALLFPMPALYAVTLSLIRQDTERTSVSVFVCVEAASG